MNLDLTVDKGLLEAVRAYRKDFKRLVIIGHNAETEEEFKERLETPRNKHVANILKNIPEMSNPFSLMSMIMLELESGAINATRKGFFERNLELIIYSGRIMPVISSLQLAIDEWIESETQKQKP